MKTRGTKTIALPPYVQPRRLQGGRTGYWWYVPKKGRVKLPDGSVWPSRAQKLPDAQGEMITTANRLHAELMRMRAGIVAPPSMREGTLGWLILRFEQSDLFKDKDPVTGEGLTPKSKHEYKLLSRHVQRWSDESAAAQGGLHPLVADLDADTIKAWLDTYLDRPSLRKHLYGYLRRLMYFALRQGVIARNPAAKLGIAEPKRKKQLTPLGPDDVMAFVRAADKAGKPWLGTGVLVHFDLGQRQNDILAMSKPEHYRDGGFWFTQSKVTKQMIVRPFMAETTSRLDRAPAGPIVQRNGLPVAANYYRKAFRVLARTLPAWVQVWETELRHFSMVYARRCGLSPEEIANRSGHSIDETYRILDRYLVLDEELARIGSAKMIAHRKKAKTGKGQ
jgi:integrase